MFVSSITEMVDPRLLTSPCGLEAMILVIVAPGSCNVFVESNKK